VSRLRRGGSVEPLSGAPGDPRPEGGISSRHREAPTHGALEPEALQVLEAKYYDWCSARLAERFLQLSPDEIYELAERGEAAAELVRLGVKRGMMPEPGSTSFRRLVEYATEVLATELALPTFVEWVAAYQESPAQFDAEILGMWRAGRG
jgi:hypothetical protein